MDKITLRRNEKDGYIYWESDNIQLSNIIAKVGSMVQFTIWDMPDDTDATETAIIQIRKETYSKSSEPFSYKDKRSGEPRVFQGMWKNSGSKDGKDWNNIASSSIDITKVIGIVTNDAKLFVSKRKEKKKPKSPDYGCTFAEKKARQRKPSENEEPQVAKDEVHF